MNDFCAPYGCAKAFQAAKAIDADGKPVDDVVGGRSVHEEEGCRLADMIKVVAECVHEDVPGWSVVKPK